MTFQAEPILSKDTHVNVNFNKTYVWELPIRIFHWINATCILVLFTTGLLIGSGGIGFLNIDDPTTSAMTVTRYTHFFTAIVFVINLLIRLYWVFKGNEYARQNPFNKEFWGGVKETTKYYLFLKNNMKHSLGHNELAVLTYWVFIGLGSIFMILSGAYLLTEVSRESLLGGIAGFIPRALNLTSWTVRSWHHIFAWLVVLFTIVHIYMGIRDSWIAKNGTFLSIFTGYKINKHK